MFISCSHNGAASAASVTAGCPSIPDHVQGILFFLFFIYLFFALDSNFIAEWNDAVSRIF